MEKEGCKCGGTCACKGNGCCCRNKDSMDMSILVLGLCSRTSNALNRGGIKTLGELVSRTEYELCRINGIGKKSMDEIKAGLKQRGLSL